MRPPSPSATEVTTGRGGGELSRGSRQAVGLSPTTAQAPSRQTRKPTATEPRPVQVKPQAAPLRETGAPQPLAPSATTASGRRLALGKPSSAQGSAGGAVAVLVLVVVVPVVVEMVLVEVPVAVEVVLVEEGVPVAVVASLPAASPSPSRGAASAVTATAPRFRGLPSAVAVGVPGDAVVAVVVVVVPGAVAVALAVALASAPGAAAGRSCARPPPTSRARSARAYSRGSPHVDGRAWQAKEGLQCPASQRSWPTCTKPAAQRAEHATPSGAARQRGPAAGATARGTCSQESSAQTPDAPLATPMSNMAGLFLSTEGSPPPAVGCSFSS
mmetsp:Transcript_39991/g.124608  ORF Transcript_39991/g.124608 Transcript_39991/m.124608 type:complete len:329 (-) Transcript_39991:583-1569(-)